MADPPRPKDARILPGPLMVWLVFSGLIFAASTLALIVWATDRFDETVAHTMGLVAFSFFHIFFSLETANEERTLFSSELFDNPTLLKSTAISVLSVFLATTFGPLQRILDTDELTAEQWGLCLVVAAVILVVCEIRKFVLRRRNPAVEAVVQQPALGQQAS